MTRPDRRLLVIALVLSVNALGSGLILPLLPFFAIELGASPLATGRAGPVHCVPSGPAMPGLP